MDYEKKYKEALGIAEKIIRYYKEHNRSDENSIEDLEQIFPELKESEDEEIRKELIRETKGSEERLFEVVTNEEFIAWLEKQGQTFTKKDVDDAYLKGVFDAKHELEKQGEKKPFDYEHATITQNDFASVGETATIELSSPIDCGDRIYHVSHKPIEKNGEQKPTEWSEEDKQEVEEFLKSLQQRFQPSLLTIVDWLKSLKCKMKR